MRASSRFSDKRTWALITARSGSKSIIDKNIQDIQGHSLLAWSILAGLGTTGISEVFVSTDSTIYADIARQYGANVPFLRPSALAGDDSTDSQVFGHFLDWALKDRGHIPDRILHLRPTTPTRDLETLGGMIEFAGEADPLVTAIRSVHIAPESPLKWFLRDADGWLTTMDGERALDGANGPRANYPTVLIPNGYGDVIFAKNFVSTGHLHGDSVLPFQTEQVVEVDDMHALTVLRALDAIPASLQSFAQDWVVQSVRDQKVVESGRD